MNKKRILVLVADYPDNEGKVKLAYIHTRNIEYQKEGFEVCVLNFSTNSSYVIDNIKVISYKEYKTHDVNYDILLCHASNIRNHYFFLKKYANRFNKIIMFYHGHEVLRINKVYSKPYFYLKVNKFKLFIQDLYDTIKLFIWKHYLPKVMSKLELIFVSNWMKNEFEKWVMNLDNYQNKVHITYNGIGESFEENYYQPNNIEYDFVTIRPYLDGSKYCIDLVVELAKSNPVYTFCIVGKGDFFKYNELPSNVVWFDTTLNHKQIVELLNKSHCSLMPTRTDAQGLMACEMATFGIPLITSNISVCHEIFDDFKSVYFISNENYINDFNEVIKAINPSHLTIKNEKYYSKNTIKKEIDIFNKIIGEKYE